MNSHAPLDQQVDDLLEDAGDNLERFLGRYPDAGQQTVALQGLLMGTALALRELSNETQTRAYFERAMKYQVTDTEPAH